MAYRTDRLEGGVSYFRAHQTNSVTVGRNGQRFMYRNLGSETFAGFELDSKYYVDKHLYLVGSTLYQRNHDGDGLEGVAPVPAFSAKFGVSYQSLGRISASLFDSYEGDARTPLPELNPPATAHHLMHAHLRVDVSRPVRAGAPGAVGLVFKINNLRNTEIWSRHVASDFDTLPVDRGRIFYMGVDVALGGRGANR